MIINGKDSKKLIENILGAITLKGGGLLINMLMTPLYIRYFNDNIVLGIWFTLYSMLSWILNFDFGIGNGLRNNLTVALSNKNNRKAGDIIFSSYFITLLFCLFLLVVYFGINRFIDWRVVLNLSSDAVSKEVFSMAINIVVISILMQMFLRTINYIYYAEQKPNVNNLTALSTSVFIVFYLWVSKYLPFDRGIVPIAWVSLIGTNLPLVIVTLIYFAKHPVYVRQKKHISTENVKDILSLGLKFFYVQLVYMVIASTNEFFINYYCGQESVVEYSIYNKLFTIIGMAITIVMLPVWSAITKAQAEGKQLWVKKLFSIFLFLGIIGMMLNIALAMFSQQIFNIWLQESTMIAIQSYSIICALYGAAIGITGVLSSFANGMGTVRIQAIMYTLIAVSKVLFAGVLSKCMGWIGIILISTVGMFAFVVIQTIDLYRKINKGI